MRRIIAGIVLALAATSCGDPDPASPSASAADIPAVSANRQWISGASLAAGPFEVQVRRVLPMQHLGQFTANSASEGAVLLVVDYAVRNVGADPVATANLPPLLLVSRDGRVLAQDAERTERFRSEYAAYQVQGSALNPGVTQRMGAVFEVAKAGLDLSRWGVSVDNATVAPLPPASRTAVGGDADLMPRDPGDTGERRALADEASREALALANAEATSGSDPSDQLHD